jgi:hypothetical protein
VYPGADATVLPCDRDRVVEVLRRVRVDREGGQVAEVDPPLRCRLGQVDRLQRHPRPALDQQPFEHCLDPARRPEHAFDLRPPATARDHGQVTTIGAVQRLAVEDDRRPRREVRLADDQLAAARDLHHCPDRLHPPPTLPPTCRGTPSHHPLRA